MTFRAPIARSLAVLAAIVALAQPARADVTVYGDALSAGWQDWSWGGITRDFARTSPVHAGTAFDRRHLHRLVERPADRSQRRDRRHRPRPLALLGARRDQRRPDSGDRGRQSPHRHQGGSQHHTGRQHVDALRCSARRPRHDPGHVHPCLQQHRRRAADLLDRRHRLRRQRPADADPARPRHGPRAAGRRRQRPPRDQPAHLRHELRRRGAGDIGCRLPVRRWGGNATTRYNWRTDTSNHASDWYFENIPNDNANPAALPDGSSSDLFVEANRRAGAETLLTVPLIGWTPRGRAYGCGFSVAQVRRPAVGRPLSQRLRQRRAHQWQRDHRQHARRRQRRDRAGLRAGLDESPDRTLRHCRSPAACASTTSTTSRCCGPTRIATSTRDPPSYDELRDRTLAYAAAIKATDPTARDARARRVGLERLLLVGARRRARRRVVEQSARPSGARQPAADRVVSSAAGRLSAAARRPPARLPRPALLSAGQRRLAVRRRQRRHAGAPPALDARVVGSDLRRRELDRRSRCS